MEPQLAKECSAAHGLTFLRLLGQIVERIPVAQSAAMAAVERVSELGSTGLEYESC